MNVNPVLERELRERVRTRGSTVAITMYLVLLLGLFALVHYVFIETARLSRSGTGAADPMLAALMGRTLFEWVLFFMLTLVLFIVPGYTSAAIAGERERQTLIPMQLTLLRPRQIAVGKVSASVAFLSLLLVASMPLLAVAYVIGGVSLGEVVRGVIALLLVGVVLAAVTVACSAVVRRVQVAAVLAYGICLLLLFGTAALYGGVTIAMNIETSGSSYATSTSSSSGPTTSQMTYSRTVSRAPGLLLALNPAMFVAAVTEGGNASRPLDRASAAARAPTPMTMARMGLRPDNTASPAPTGFEGFLPLTLLSMAGLTVGCVALAARRLRLPAELDR